MFGAMTSLTGGGGLSASGSASSDQQSSNDISTGTISVGGLNMGPKPSAFDADMVLKGGAAVGLALGALWALKKIKRA
jgi:hypothetical protein